MERPLLTSPGKPAEAEACKIKKKLKKIDEAVYQRIQELQELLHEGGMDEATVKISKCLPKEVQEHTGRNYFIGSNVNTNVTDLGQGHLARAVHSKI